jgi:hypothetical protein
MSEASITPNCVLLGRGGATNNHVGNKRFRSIVAAHQREYLSAKKLEKVVIARQIVSEVHANGGRYLKRSQSSDEWVEVPVRKAISKTSQALREGLDVRNRTVRKTPQKHDGESASSGKGGKVVEGRVASTASPALVSLSGPYGEVPYLRDDFMPQMMNPALMYYHPPPVSKRLLKHAFEV